MSTVRLLEATVNEMLYHLTCNNRFVNFFWVQHVTLSSDWLLCSCHEWEGLFWSHRKRTIRALCVIWEMFGSREKSSGDDGMWSLFCELSVMWTNSLIGCQRGSKQRRMMKCGNLCRALTAPCSSFPELLFPAQMFNVQKLKLRQNEFLFSLQFFVWRLYCNYASTLFAGLPWAEMQNSGHCPLVIFDIFLN